MKKEILSAIGAALAACLILLLVVLPNGTAPVETTVPTQNIGVSIPGTTVTGVPVTRPTTPPVVPPI